MGEMLATLRVDDYSHAVSEYNGLQDLIDVACAEPATSKANDNAACSRFIFEIGNRYAVASGVDLSRLIAADQGSNRFPDSVYKLV